MTEKIQQSLRDSKTARWIALFAVSFTMLCGYYFTDVMAPIKGLLIDQLHWNSTEYGFFTGAYGWFNVFLFMLIIGGIILDKMGIRFAGMLATVLMVSGASIKYWAVSTSSLDGVSWNILWWNYKAQVWIAGLGFAVFGVGIEVAGITVSKTIVKWFKGKEMALAMGLEMAMARIGTGLALAVSLPIATSFKLSTPVLAGVIMLCIGLLSFFMYTFQDRKSDKEIRKNSSVDPSEKFELKDIISIITNKGWWYIAVLCVLFYSAVFPFLKYATDLMIQKFHVSPELAGTIPALLPFGNILLTPFFGNLYDRKGKGATIMIIGSIMLICIHGLFSLPGLDQWWFAVLLVIMLGIAFSMVPSAMWPSVPKIIPEKQLGTAYSLVFWVQNWGLMGMPMFIGYMLDKYCIVGKTVLENGAEQTLYNYTLPMIIFACSGIIALMFAFLLKAEDKKKGYGLEMPNIK